MKFLVFEDNGGAYHWTIVASSGETLCGPRASPPTRRPSKPLGSCTPALPQRRSSPSGATLRRSISLLAAKPRWCETIWTPSAGWTTVAASAARQ
ncbi:MAG TPA: hypothetical protein VMG37_11895 [Solirubrobacteraceae bacterium]|nr:hypothetical protein [Solirubrobacteraceae bacterium]